MSQELKKIWLITGTSLHELIAYYACQVLKLATQVAVHMM